MFLLAVTLMSMLLAAIMSVIAWRIAIEERRRSDARIATLAAEIHGAAPPPLRVAPRRPDDDLELRPAAAGRAGADLFAVTRPAASRSRPLAVLGIGVLAFGGVMALAIMLSAGSRAATSPAATVNGVAAGRTVPLELVALGHQRDGDRLTVRGIVRNPASGNRVDGLTAVVFLFNRDGGFVASGRATVAPAPLGPGSESTFVVTVPGASDVGRYRVSFRTDDHVVPHIDKRSES
jgi:hypothetical protein